MPRKRTLPRISVVLARIDDHEGFVEILRSYTTQSLPWANFEILVVDSPGVRPWQEDWARHRREHPGFKVRRFRTEKRSRAAANNEGARRSRAPVLAFIADDILPDAKTLEAYIRFHVAHRAPGDWAVGPVVSPEDLRTSPFLQWAEDSGRLFGVAWTRPSPVVPPDYFSVANASIKTAMFRRAGGFREEFTGSVWDDYELGIRLAEMGGHACRLPAARGLHLHALTLAERREAIWHAGQGAHQLEKFHSQAWPWQRRARCPAWIWGAARLVASAAHALLDLPPIRHAYYRMVLAESFQRGYRAARRSADGASRVRAHAALTSVGLAAVLHLVVSSALMLTSFSVVMRRSFQRDFENYVPPRAVQASETWLHTAADVLWSPLAACADPAGCTGLTRIRPGACAG